MTTASSNSNLILDEENQLVDEDQTNTQEPTKWICGTFRKRTCQWFIPATENEYLCCCGRKKHDHSGDALLSTGKKGDEWETSKHSVCKPTNAYGELEFQGAGQVSRAKYIRVSDDTDPEMALQLLSNEWKLNFPKLLISVTGGAKNFVLHSKLKQVLRQGLRKAAQTTGAWIFTGGTNTGVMRHVGEAVRGQTVMSHGAQLRENTQQVHLIGIATWGIVDHREQLVCNQDVVPYQMTSSMMSQGACLDNNHTHFILVDDGRINRYGGEISFRASLENCISRKQMEKSCDRSYGVPVVLLVLEGGPNTIRTVLESVTRTPAVPVVVAEGSGRAADVLAYAHRFISQSSGEFAEMADVVEHHQLLVKIENAFPEFDEEGCLTIYENVLRCVENKRFITVFSVDEEGMDIDRAILRALLNGPNVSPSHQLSLALIWNRADIAKSEIFRDDRKWEISALESAMFEALIKDRVDFVDLLLENGVSMSSFLTARRLEDLYRGRARRSPTLLRLIGGKMAIDSFKLDDIRNITERLLGITDVHPYRDYGSIKKGIGMANMKMFMTTRDDSYFGIGFKLPYSELLIWAVLSNLQSMALFVWERGDETLAKALVAGKLFKSLADETAKDELKVDMCDELLAHSRAFLSIALGLLDECYRTNEDLAQQLLTYNLDNWGDQCCLSIAVGSRHEEFVAHACCQTLLTKVWMGALKVGKWASLGTMLSILVPPTIAFKEFKNKKELCQEYKQERAKKGQTLAEKKYRVPNMGKAKFDIRDSQVNLSCSESNDSLNDVKSCKNTFESIGPFEMSGESDNLKNDLCIGEKLYEFYRAPITKFWGNVIVYFIFLLVFCYVVLLRLPPNPPPCEVFLIIFVFTLCTEEMRQVLQSEPKTLHKKFEGWASSKWNLCDASAVLLFFIGFGFRMSPGTIEVGHTFYCIDIMLWIVRVLDIFSVSKVLGPYVVMIGRMTIDMTYFLLIVVVFLMAYGVAQQSILFPQEAGSWELVPKVFFRPYFQIYGELFIEDNVYSDDLNSTAFNTPRHSEFGGPLVTVIMALFLLVANILLLNLLIAIFNNTFSDVHANSNQIWKFQRYHLIMEYANRPVLVPPFIIINHLHILYKACCERRCCTRRKKLQMKGTNKKLNLFLEKQDVHKLMIFEEQCTESYLRQKDTLFHATSEERVRAIGSRVEWINNHLRETTRDNETKVVQISKKVNSIEDRLSRMEEYTLQILDMLVNIQEPLSSPFQEQEDDVATKDSRNKESGLKHESMAKEAPKRMYSRMMSVPSYVYRLHSGSNLSIPSTPMYFRHKLPNSNPYPPWYRQVSKGNWHRNSVQKAIEKFKKNNMPPSIDGPFATAQESRLQSQIPFKKLPLVRSDSEGTVLSKGQSLSLAHRKNSGRTRSETLPCTVAIEDTFQAPKEHGLHVQARLSPYPGTQRQRYPVPDFLVDWQIPFPGYAPPVCTACDAFHDYELGDVDLTVRTGKHVQISFNDIDSGVDRRSHQGVYDVVDGIPRNPSGRTGIAGRGMLGRWGPNHTANAIITRWKRTSKGKLVERFGKHVLEVVTIQRQDSLEWVLPGGVVDVNDTISRNLRKNFCEELLSSPNATGEEQEIMSKRLEHLFSCGKVVYKGYVDDPRNTDNAWIETVCINFHDDTGRILNDIQLKSSDLARGIQWQDVSGQLNLYQSYTFILKRVAEQHSAVY